MPVVYKGSNNIQSDADGIVGIIALVGVAIGIGAIIFIAISLYTSVVSLTFPAFINALTVFSPTSTSSLANCFIMALEGMLAGYFIGCMKKSLILENISFYFFLSELFSFDAFKSDLNFISTMILSLLVGGTVGWIAGASGTIGLTTFLYTDSHSIIHNILETSQPIVAIVMHGGAGGAGSSGGFFWVVLIILIFVFQGIIVGAASGLTFGVLMGSLNGAIKGGALKYVCSLIVVSDKPETKREITWRSSKKGFIEGAIVGGIVGLIQGLLTSIAFYDKNK